MRNLPSALLLAFPIVLAAGPLAQAAPPTPVDDLLLVAADSNVTTDYLLANDSDPDGDALTITGASPASHGLVTDQGDGVLVYSPAPGYVGDDSFDVDVSDGETTVSSTVHVSVNATFDVQATRDALLAGVDSLANPTQPGHMVAWGPTAYPISNYPGQDERDPMIVAATMGAGRVVAMPDHQWANMNSYGDDASTGTFYLNAVAWLAGTDSGAIKVVTAKVGAATWLGEQGYSNVVETDMSGLAAELPDADVLVVWPGSSASQAEIDTIVAFVKLGGGVLLAEYGAGYDWWWGKDGPDIPGNRVLRHAGIGFTKEWPASGVQQINASSGQITDDHVAAVIQTPADYADKDKEQIAVVLNRINASLAASDTTRARLAVAVADKLESIVPTPESPVSDALEKALLNEEALGLHGVPVDAMTDHRAALPVDPDAPRVTQSVTLAEPAQGHAYLVIDTGLYAAPGEVIDVTVPEALAGIGLEVQIGHLRTDTGDANYYVMPHQQLFYDVSATQLQVASPHGGLLMFVAPAGTEWVGDETVVVDGAVEVPWFVFGEHTNADWLEVRDRGTPFGVLRCATTVLVIESEGHLRDLDDPHEVMAVWEPLIEEIAGFYAYDRGRELRIHHDYQPAGGVSAFPLSYGVSSVLTDSHALRVQGHPLTMHEHGHHADSGQIIFHEFGETSPNIGGKYAQYSYSNFAWKQELPVGRVNNYVFTLSDDLWDHFNHYRVDVKVTPFDSIASVFGWETVKAVVHALTALPGDQADTSQQVLDQWLAHLGAETGFDLAPFLELWQLSFSEEGKAAVADLPAWNMVETVAEDLVVEQDTAVTFGDPSVNDFSYDGTLELLEVSAPAHGTLDDHGNGTWTYTPAPSFVGKDAIEYTVANGIGNTFIGTLEVTVTPAEDFPRVETGNVDVGTSGWAEVTLEGAFESPVVIAQAARPEGGPPVVTRVRNATAGSFEVTLQRADGGADPIEDVQVQYLVVEAGVYDVATHGVKMEAALVSSSVTDSAGDFTGQPLALAHDDWDHYFIPALFGQVMTANDPAWSAFWAEGSALGYAVGKHVGEDVDTERADETLGYVIFESGSLQIGGVRLQVGALQFDGYPGFSNVGSGGNSHLFSRMPALAGGLVQSLGLDDAEDGYWTELEAPVAADNRVGARLVEDTLGDDEQGHGAMGGSYLLFADFVDGLTAIDDAVGAIEETPNLVDPVTNDLSTFGALLSLATFGQPAHGVVTENQDGTLTYTPDAGFLGEDSFSYEVTDGSATDAGLVRISVAPQASSEAGVLMETWFGLDGNAISTLTSSADYPDAPDESEIMPTFEAPVDRANDFGTRMRAHLLPPVTGDYTFWIASDDEGQLWLSTDLGPANASQIASVSGWTSSQEWDKYASQQSAPVALEAGQAYYIEALHKEGGGGDNLAVAWEGPGLAQTVIGEPALMTVGLHAPVAVAPLDDVDVVEGAPDSTIDVSGVFTDADPGDSLTLALHANSDPALVTAVLVDGELTLSYAPDAHGQAELTVRATDQGGAMATDTLTVTVNAVHFPPEVQDLAVTLLEDSSLGPIGAIAASDPDPEQSLTFTLVTIEASDLVDVDPDSGEVSLIGALDFEQEEQHVLQIEVTDDAPEPQSAIATVTIDVLDVNEPPSVALLDALTSLPEDTSTAAPIAMATVAVIDDALGEETLALTGADSDAFELDAGVLWLKAGAALDFETQPTLTVSVTVDDPTVGDTPDGEATLAVEVTWVAVDECQDDPCAPDATCTDTSDAFTCACDEGYVGDGFSCAVDCANTDCSDGDPCTDDACDPTTGCSWSDAPAGTVACDDGDGCTSPDLCESGACVGEPIVCDDDDACTTDACVDGECLAESIEGCCLSDLDCVAGDLCSVGTCSAPGGTCAYDPLDDCCLTDDECEPSEPCVEATCPEPGEACEETPIDGCCTEDADCEPAGPCVETSCDLDTETCGGLAVPDCCADDAACDDANPCTADTCDVTTGECASLDVAECCLSAAECDDDDPCTADLCEDLACASEPVEGCCIEDEACDDGDPCTADACVDHQCANDLDPELCPEPDGPDADTNGGEPDAEEGDADGPADDDTGPMPGDAGAEDTSGPGAADAGDPATDAGGGGTPGGGCEASSSGLSGLSGLAMWALLTLWVVIRRRWV